jgi:hypothetical protein
MFLLNAVNARADAGLVAYGLARRAGIRRVIYFSIFRVNQFATFRMSPPGWVWKAHCGNFGVPFTVIRAAYWFQNEIRSGARRTAKEILPWCLPQLKNFSAANPNAVWAIGSPLRTKS